ncbi:DUF4407 domain-containing protein [Nonomuraea typhae]|uniref:DUF4407 domain-containing protein n=1 Tax=Nonomuraea typhae TaxID=2603600 RepID=UPI0012F91A49|nr:DUF4407 domain-containing protein [Nonomuraea typhae]
MTNGDEHHHTGSRADRDEHHHTGSQADRDERHHEGVGADPALPYHPDAPTDRYRAFAPEGGGEETADYRAFRVGDTVEQPRPEFGRPDPEFGRPRSESGGPGSELGAPHPEGVRGMSRGRRWEVARWVRVLAGVDEGLLDRVPEERPRYTGLGGVVLGTAAVAFVSMLAALVMVFGGGWTLLVAVPLAVLWAILIGNFDRWLVAGGHGVMGWTKKLTIMLPRLIVATLLGVIIAEPVVLAVFDSAVQEQVKLTRSTANLAYEDALKRCNPAPDASGGIPAAPAGCAAKALTLSLAGAPTERLAERDQLKRQHDELTGKVAADRAELARRQDLARRECNGTGGAGLTGRAGEGPNCARNRAEADAFAEDSKLAANTATLASLNDRLTRLNTDLGASSTTYARDLSAKIQQKVAERRAQQGHIGLLERLEALGVLKDRSGMLFVAIWLVTLFFIVIDVMPALVKFLSPTTTYDELVTRRLEVRRRMQERANEVELRRNMLAADEELRTLSRADRRSRARHEVDLDRLRADLAARL